MVSNPRVLLVDDDPDIGLALSDYLKQEGFEIELVNTGTDALQKGLSQHYDVVLLDVGLPDRNGLEVLAELAGNKPDLPIILLTAFSSLHKTARPEQIEKAFAYIIKPFRREEVKATLHRALIRPEISHAKNPGTTIFSRPTLPFPAIIQARDTPAHQATGPRYQLSLDEYQRFAEYVQCLQFAFDLVPEGILIADTEKHFRFANQAAAFSLGYTKEELLTMRIPDIAPNHDNQRYQHHLKELRQGNTLSYPTVHRTKQGRDIPLNISIYLLNYQGQEFTFAVTQSGCPEPKENPQEPPKTPVPCGP